MGVFTRRRTVEELEEDRDRLEIEEEVVSRRASIAEKEALIRQAKKMYGSDWKSKLGLSGKIDLQTLRTVLSDMKRGLNKDGGVLYNPKLNPAPPGSMRMG